MVSMIPVCFVGIAFLIVLALVVVDTLDRAEQSELDQIYRDGQ